MTKVIASAFRANRFTKYKYCTIIYIICIPFEKFKKILKVPMFLLHIDLAIETRH
jgi:hypothetical protein